MEDALFDAHCDTISKILNSGGALKKNTYHLDLERISNLGIGYGQVFAAFMDKENIRSSPFEYTKRLIEAYFKEVKDNEYLIEHCLTYKDIEDAWKKKKVASLLAVEGGEAIEGDISKLEELFLKGVRIMTLTWNHPNEICDGIGVTDGRGLTEFGREVVLKMNDLGMLIDVSHISKQGFWDVLALSKRPIAATHSNAFAIKNHARNLDDEEIKQMVATGGFVGINLYSEFLSDEKASMCDIIRHVEHILSLGGENILGFGGDFDGMDDLPHEINGVQDYKKIIEEFRRIGYKDSLIKKITSDNFLRVIKEVIG